MEWVMLALGILGVAGDAATTIFNSIQQGKKSELIGQLQVAISEANAAYQTDVNAYNTALTSIANILAKAVSSPYRATLLNAAQQRKKEAESKFSKATSDNASKVGKLTQLSEEISGAPLITSSDKENVSKAVSGQEYETGKSQSSKFLEALGDQLKKKFIPSIGGK